MATSIIMPRQGQSVESCIISRWLKSPGEFVKKGDILFAYETDKASFEAEAETDGFLIQRLFEEGDEVPVLQIVAYLGAEAEIPPQIEISAGLNTLNASSVTSTEKPGKTNVDFSPLSPGLNSSGKIKISPRARNRAASLSLPVENITGTGPGGRIMEVDVLNASNLLSPSTPLAKELSAENKLKMPVSGTGLGGRITSGDVLSHAKESSEDSEIVKISNVRKIIARKMHESLQNSAQLTHHTSADARAMIQIRNKIKSDREKGIASENITINDMVCFAVIRALKKHPDANCHFLTDSIKKFKKVHLGLAIDTERGLMVPALRNADDLTIQVLSSRIKTLADNCRKGNVDPELLAGESASFTVSNLGSYGVEIFTPVINLPQVAILGVNTIIHRPADIGNGIFGFIPYIGLSLTYDHRALDGAPASAFLREIKLEIEKFDSDLCTI